MKKIASPKHYKIEKGIKIPPVTQQTGVKPGAVALTLQVLQPGDSFLVKDELAALKARTVAIGMGRSDRKFTARKVGKGVRIWRVK